MTTTPFLGCKISLISKSEIRYEGILYTIDPKESTIALAKVRSFGTEDRVAERKVPPRDEIFEYIIFRAGDIKDLIVDDPPKSISPGLADPAIIQAHSTSTTTSVTLPSPAFQQMTNAGIANNTSGARQTSSAFHTSDAPTHVGNIPVSYTTTSDTHSGRSTPTTQRKSPQNLMHSSGKTTPQNNAENRMRSGQQGGQMRRGGGGGFQYNRRGGGFRTQNNYSQPPQMNNRYSGNRAYDFNSYDRMNQRRGPPLRPPLHQRFNQNFNRANVRSKDPIKFEGEFDFEKSEQEFKELEQKFSNLKVEGEDQKKVENSDTNDAVNNGTVEESQENESHCYDKEKSFFDNISCEAIERSKGNAQRIDWKAERKLNHETFGVSTGYRRQGYRGGYGGGYGGGFGGGFGGRGRRNFRGGGFGSNRAGGGDSRRYSGGPNRK